MGAPVDLKIPYALDGSGAAITPDTATKSMQLQCPECKRAVLLKAGECRRPHFAHTVDDVPCAFRGESAMHALAKHLIILAVEDWRSGNGPAPQVEFKCAKGRHWHLSALKEAVCSAVPEKTLYAPCKTKTYRPDVVLLNRHQEPILCIEVFFTHAVDEDKKDKLEKWTIEVDAEDIVQNPLTWRCMGQWHLKQDACSECIEDEKQAKLIEEKRKRLEQREKVIAQNGKWLSVTWRKQTVNHYKYGTIEKRLREVEPCPIAARTYKRRRYANIEIDCAECLYRVDQKTVMRPGATATFINVTQIKCAGDIAEREDEELYRRGV